MRVRPGSTVTVTTNLAFGDLVVGDPNTADVVPLSDRSLYVQGKAPGFTNVTLYDENRNVLGIIDVRVELSTADVDAAVRAAVPGSNIRVSVVNNRIRLSGSVANASDQSRALQAAAQFSPNPVINALSIGDTQQVSLEVRVLEASRTAGRELGINTLVAGGSTLGAIGPRVNVNVNPDTNQLAQFVTDGPAGNQTQVPFGTLVANILSVAGVRIDVMIDALEAKGLARRLAQPNLTAVSGEVAKFHAGGEVPITSAVNFGGSAGTQVDYRPYGVRLEFVPTVLDGAKVNLRVLTEVSEIDRTVNVNGNPGFISRKVESVVELRDGQSFAMAGLLQTINARDIQQLPWIGQLPVLGPLFRSTSFQKRESDLVIVVTPRLVRPAAPSEKLYSPLDQTRPSDDVELFALGLLEVDKDMLRAFRDGEGIIGDYGHRIDLEFEDPYVTKKK
ncbi:MAG: type II and III secretion system protein family protein [Rhizobiaceae bacterium]